MADRANIRLRIRQRADIEGDTVRFPDTELNQYINDSLKRLQSKLLVRGILRREHSQYITADGSSSYALPDDFLATVSVFEKCGQDIRRLRRHQACDGPFDEPGLYRTTNVSFYRTAIKEQQKRIEFKPTPTSGTYIHAYIPLVSFSADTDTFDDDLAWDEYIVVDVSIKCRMKDNIEVSDFRTERNVLLSEIFDDAEAMDQRDGYVIRTDEGYDDLRNDPADYSPWGKVDY